MPSGWLRDYTRALAPRWWVGALAIFFTVIGGIAGAIFLAEKVGMMSTTSFLVVAGLILLGISLVFNLRQAFLWKPDHAARVSAEQALAKLEKQATAAQGNVERSQHQAAVYQRLYEEEEQDWWTENDVNWDSEAIRPLRMGEPAGLRICVRSREPITPIRLRFWFSAEIKDPNVTIQFDPEAAKNRLPFGVLAGKVAEVHPGGRVDVRWETASLSREGTDALSGDSVLKLVVFAVDPATPPQLLRVQRRKKVL